jgi:selenoprotein W-related protein
MHTQPARVHPQSRFVRPDTSGEKPPTGSERPRIAVRIEYCEPGNYERPARRLAQALREESPDLDLEVELIPSSGGCFEVEVAGRLVYSKKATRLLPAADEIAYHLRAAATAARR